MNRGEISRKLLLERSRWRYIGSRSLRGQRVRRDQHDDRRENGSHDSAPVEWDERSGAAEYHAGNALFRTLSANASFVLHPRTLPQFTPQLQLETLFVLDDEGRIRHSREPNATRGPAFSLIRDAYACAWAVNADVPSDLARELAALARNESPVSQLTDPPRYADAYTSLIGGRIDSGPVFTFPPTLAESGQVTTVTDLSELEHHFRGWTADEIPERSPIVGIAVDGHVVSVCFCARRTEIAAEAGVETAVEYRGRGFAPRATAAWARLTQDSGRLALYSTSWDNAASLAVARKLGLSACASDWNLYR